MKTTPHSVLRLAISLGIAIAATVMAPASASAQILFTTQDDFNGWSSGGNPVITPVTTPDFDGVTINGLGNASDGPGASDTAGSLGGSLTSQTYYASFFSPNQSGNAAFVTALESASTITLDYSGTLYSAPQMIINWSGGYDGVNVTSVTPESGPGGSYDLVTYNFAAEAASIQAYQASNPIYYLNLGFITGGVSGATFNLDAITADPAAAPEPSTTAMLALGGLGLIMLLRRRKLA